MDKIIIEDLEIYAHHGVFPEEKEKGQTFFLSAILHTDTRKAGLTDDLENSINYGMVSHMMTDFVQQNTFDLLETVVEKLAEKMLKEFPSLQEVTLRIDKPEAPVGLPFGTVAVEITRKWHIAYIALGSNMGDKKAYINGALAALDDMDDCVVESVSSLIETAPYGYTNQDDFLNGCLCLKTLLTPQELLDRLHEIEAAADRKREVRWGPRTLDLDIIMFDDLVMDTLELHIPHIDMHRREFVLRPLAEIAPWVRHPVIGKTVLELANEL